MAALSDEEQDDDLPSANLSAGSTKVAERVQLEASISKWAPLEKTRQQVMLKVMVASSSSARDRLGLDLVVVLDVSGEKLANKMKNAMQFIISKLSPMDRLCIVGTTGANNRLQFMTKDARAELRGAVDGGLQLQVAGAGGGLETGLHVLAAGGWLPGGPRRTASVLLMSDCKQQPRPRLVETMPNSVVVHTFGFGQDNDLTVLEKIAHKSPGGTFNFVSEEEEENLSAPISQILAGLLSVVVQDLKLIMWTERGFRDKVESTIEKVDAGSCYPHRWGGSNLQPDSALGVTVSFGDLYSGEDRKVIVDLLTPAVESGYKKATVIVAQCSYSYSTQKEAFDSPKTFSQNRNIRPNNTLTGLPVPPALKAELLRRRHADMLGEAASTMDYIQARGKLLEAWTACGADEKPNPIKAELELLLNLNKWADLHACLLAAIMSHCRQRFTARGDVMRVRLFDTPLMRMYMVQAHKFGDDPDRQKPPSADEDVEEEEEKEMLVVSGRRPPHGTRFRGIRKESTRSSWRAWMVMVMCMVLAIGAILAGVAMLTVFLLYKPQMPYLVVSDAQLRQLLYNQQDGTIQSLRVSITILAKNNYSKVGASFSSVDISLGFHGADIALLRAKPFMVAQESSIALHYQVVSAGPVLDTARMNESLKVGLVPLDLLSKARTRWKAGIFVRHTYWTHISCRLTFLYPGNGTVMPIDSHRCHSRSP